jgi:adenylate kinase
MKLVFVGPQGSGKGTQAKKVAERFSLCHISTGDLLRGVTGDLKVEVDEGMGRGELVSDELVVRILRGKLDSSECERGFILDGFPRNSQQAEMLDEIAEVDKVVEIFITDDEAARRVCGRRNCKSCGEIFNIYSKRPKVSGICDVCGGELVARVDDNEEALRRRLRVYHDETEPILKRYTFVRVDGDRSIEKVFEDIVEKLS